MTDFRLIGEISRHADDLWGRGNSRKLDFDKQNEIVIRLDAFDRFKIGIVSSRIGKLWYGALGYTDLDLKSRELFDYEDDGWDTGSNIVVRDSGLYKIRVNYRTIHAELLEPDETEDNFDLRDSRDFYIAGSFNRWLNDDIDSKFRLKPVSGNIFTIELDLERGDEFKLVACEDGKLDWTVAIGASALPAFDRCLSAGTDAFSTGANVTVGTSGRYTLSLHTSIISRRGFILYYSINYTRSVG